MRRPQRVAIVYKSLPQWRRRFFEFLRDRLAREAIRLQLIYGQPGIRAGYPEKRLSFLIEACELIRQLIPDFEIIFIGARTDSEVVAQAGIRHSWIKYLGPRFDDQKVPYFHAFQVAPHPRSGRSRYLGRIRFGCPVGDNGRSGPWPRESTISRTERTASWSSRRRVRRRTPGQGSRRPAERRGKRQVLVSGS
jgi:hypothetical protein